MRNLAFRFSALSMILLLVVLSCVKQNLISGNGVLKGKISIGPLCPVERIPPDPNCLPTMATYKAWATAVWTLNKNSKIATIVPNLDGTYQIDIPTGNYIIDFATNQISHIGGSNIPKTISISNMDTTIYNINIDTGIR